MERQVQEMRAILREKGNEYVRRFEEVLAPIALRGDPACIRPLLPLFDDEAEFDEINFSLLHTIEQFSPAVYVEEITKGLPAFVASAPRWAQIVHIGILNSPMFFRAYTERARNLTDEQAASVRTVLRSLCKREPQFEDRCTELLAVLPE